jgi:protein SDA1
VLTEMYRRNIWTDAKTVNLVVEACRHPSQKILIAALKFFEGQDEAAEAAAMEGDESDDDADPADREASMKSRTQVSKEDVFKAYKTVRELFTVLLCVCFFRQKRSQ